MHANNDLRDEFLSAIDSGKYPSKAVLGRLYNCSDILPSHCRAELRDWRFNQFEDEPLTYSQAARRILAHLKWMAQIHPLPVKGGLRNLRTSILQARQILAGRPLRKTRNAKQS